jgi:aldehyde dehydrogenase (NAD+)
VFADVDNSGRLAREEVFGPVMAVIPFDGMKDGGIGWAPGVSPHEREFMN